MSRRYEDLGYDSPEEAYGRQDYSDEDFWEDYWDDDLDADLADSFGDS